MWWTGGVWSTLTTSMGFSRNQGLENTAVSISLQLPVPLAYSSVLNGHERRKHNTVAIILMIASLCTRQHWLWHDIKDRSVREAGSSQLSLLEHLCNGNRQWCKQLNYSFFFFFFWAHFQTSSKNIPCSFHQKAAKFTLKWLSHRGKRYNLPHVSEAYEVIPFPHHMKSIISS